MTIRLDPRLAAAASLVLPGLPAADIGSDHAHLAVYLATHGLCPLVIASDKAQGPYERARTTVEELGLGSRIQIRRGDGLSVLAPGEADTLILCGMGGLLIIEILSAGQEVAAAAQRLVLQPQRNAGELRLWLTQNGWRIVREELALDKGAYYWLLAAEPGEQRLSPLEAEFGPCLLEQRPPLFRQMLGQRLEELEAVAKLLEGQRGAGAARRRRQLEMEKERIQAILHQGEEK